MVRGNGARGTHRGMTSDLLNVTLDCVDAESVASFWSEVTGRAMSHVDMPGNPFWVIPLGSSVGPQLVFVTVEKTKTVKNRVHLDIVPAAGTTQAKELERLLSLGGTVVDDRRELDPGGWIVMADPEGNEFCLEAGNG